MRRIAMTMLAALLLAQPLPQDAVAQDGEICALQDQQVRVLRKQVAQLQRQLWYANIKKHRHDLWLDRCLSYGRSLRGELETCQEELASCEEELRICTDPCRDVSCQPWQECRVYEPTGEAFCADTCNGFECPAGTRCQLVDVVCVRAPCPPVAECVPDDVCQLPPDVGPCDAVVPRWFHNGGTGECEPFTWGGCGGNGNNFETREACERSCPPANVCELPPETGSCEAAILRWYHDPFTNQCTTFTYGGCGGNANNFQSYEDCVQTCPRRSDRCEPPAETGPCAAAFLRWHFNRDTGSCETFTWGGCGGNENRFETLDDCMFTCGLTP